MIGFPNCKINLGLNIINKRDDGFHNIETVFYPLTFHDALEIFPAESFSLKRSGIHLPGKEDDDLCVKAYSLLKKDIPRLPAIDIHLLKAIPAGAGLGGGSADAAFTLKMLSDIFRLNLSTDQLINYAAQLGSDCPFFIINKACFATGRGEILEPIDLNLSTYSFVLINPGIHINTAEAFSRIVPKQPTRSIKQLVQQPIASWKDSLMNDFEETIFTSHSKIKAIKEELYNKGAVYASMSGSGSTVFGIFEKNKIPKLSFTPSYLVKKII